MTFRTLVPGCPGSHSAPLRPAAVMRGAGRPCTWTGVCQVPVHACSGQRLEGRDAEPGHSALTAKVTRTRAVLTSVHKTDPSVEILQGRGQRVGRQRVSP